MSPASSRGGVPDLFLCSIKRLHQLITDCTVLRIHLADFSNMTTTFENCTDCGIESFEKLLVTLSESFQ